MRRLPLPSPSPSPFRRTILVRLQRFALPSPKGLSPLALCLCLCACGHRSEFDVTPDQIAKKAAAGPGPGGSHLDLNHLPPGAVKAVHKYKKGDTLPDGSIADRDRTVTMVTLEKSVPGGGRRVLKQVQEERQESK